MIWLLFLPGFPYVKSLYFEEIPDGSYLMINSRFTNSAIEAAIFNQVVTDWNYNVFNDYPYALQMDFYAQDCDTTPGNICLTDNPNDPKDICDDYDESDPVYLGQTCYRRKRVLGIFPTKKIEWAVIFMPSYDSTHITWSASPDSGKWHGPTIVRHEIAHAVGLGHDRDDMGSLLMKPILPPGEYRGIDSVVRDAVYCKYGRPDAYTPPGPGQAGLRVLKPSREEVKQEKDAVACPIFQVGGCGYVPPGNCDMDSVLLVVRDTQGDTVYTRAGDPNGCVFQTQWFTGNRKGRYQVQATVWFSGQPVSTAPLWIYVYSYGSCVSGGDEGILAAHAFNEPLPDQPGLSGIRVIPGGVRLLPSDEWRRVEVWDVAGRSVVRMEAEPARETRIFLKRGVYILRLYQNGRARVVRKIVIP